MQRQWITEKTEKHKNFTKCWERDFFFCFFPPLCNLIINHRSYQPAHINQHFFLWAHLLIFFNASHIYLLICLMRTELQPGLTMLRSMFHCTHRKLILLQVCLKNKNLSSTRCVSTHVSCCFSQWCLYLYKVPIHRGKVRKSMVSNTSVTLYDCIIFITNKIRKKKFPFQIK